MSNRWLAAVKPLVDSGCVKSLVDCVRSCSGSGAGVFGGVFQFGLAVGEGEGRRVFNSSLLLLIDPWMGQECSKAPAQTFKRSNSHVRPHGSMLCVGGANGLKALLMITFLHLGVLVHIDTLGHACTGIPTKASIGPAFQRRSLSSTSTF